MAKVQSEEDKKKEAEAKAQAELVAKKEADEKTEAEAKVNKEAEAKAQADADAEKEVKKEEVKVEKVGKKIADKFYWGFRRFGSITPYSLMKEFGRVWTAILDMKADIEELKGKK